MSTKQVVDTHALIWFLTGDRRLGANAEAILRDPNSELVLPAIVLAEACWIVEHGRSQSLTVAGLVADIDADPRVEILPLTREIVCLTVTLTSIREMHDRQIVATGIQLSQNGDTVALLTRDQHIAEAGLIPVIW